MVYIQVFSLAKLLQMRILCFDSFWIFSSIAGNSVFRGRRWVDPSSTDGRSTLVQNYTDLCIRFPALRSSCTQDQFVRIISLVRESWSLRLRSNIWRPRKKVVGDRWLAPSVGSSVLQISVSSELPLPAAQEVATCCSLSGNGVNSPSGQQTCNSDGKFPRVPKLNEQALSNLPGGGCEIQTAAGKS